VSGGAGDSGHTGDSGPAAPAAAPAAAPGEDPNAAAAAGLFAALCPRGAALSREFLRTPDGQVLRYGELRAQSARLAHVLVGLGVRPGDRVAVQVEKSVHAVLLYFAALRAGAVYLPLNPAYTAAELHYFLADAEPALFVCAPQRLQRLRRELAALSIPALATLGPDAPDDSPAAASGSLALAIGSQPETFEDVARSAADPAAILYTSGTTGRSKGAVLTHGNLLANARTLAQLWRFTPQDVLLHALPIFHIHGLFVALNVALAAGATVRLLPRFDPALVLGQLPVCSVMMGVPTFYVRLLRERELTRARTAAMRLFISGSAPLPVETFHAWRERTGHAILERYGLSETGMNCSNPCDGERRAGSVGPPLPDVALRITDPVSGAPLPVGEVGMIEVRGPNVFAGYWRAPEKTRQVLRPDGFFITGDLGHLDEHGYVTLVGRATDLIISGGYNVYPREVESEIDTLPGVLESAVIGLPHPDWGEAVTAVVVPAAPSGPSAPARSGAAAGSALGAGPAATAASLGEADFIAALRGRLAAYKLPKRVLFLTELPRNVMGKVQKAQLRAQYAHLYDSPDRA
jgi:malonyl-CoA/methylmalonyl-CoA synthetase